MNSTKEENQLNAPLAVVTIHDACHVFSSKIFEFIGEVEDLDINYNIVLVHYLNKSTNPSLIEIIYATI